MERNKMKLTWIRGILFLLLCFGGMICIVCRAEAGMHDNPFVTFSPDGNAFTTNVYDTDTEWYENGYTIDTGNVSRLGTPDVGEHYYSVIKTGDIPIGKWVVEHAFARCIHSRVWNISSYHGVEFRKEVCQKAYFSGWMSYCADCGQKVVDNYFYMDKETAKSITKLDMSLAYYYRCPHCTHLEQGVELKQHACKDISANQYVVRYHANFGKGYMPKSVHMYNNATMYEGREITPQKTLTLNSYTRVGYEFVGWNTQKDGSGRHYEDGAEIWNLSSEEQGSVILYAQWKKSQSTLVIDPNGGRYNGSYNISEVLGAYGSTYEFAASSILPPEGATVHFETNGGQQLPDITGQMIFSEWSFKQPSNGELQDNIYVFRGKDGSVDYATAVYNYQLLILPDCQREGYSFGGWYYDAELTRMAGSAGTEFKTTKDIILYACWVDLQLMSNENYQANGGKGAVDLAWNQNDSRVKTYLLYQKQEGGVWKKIHSADEMAVEKHLRQEYGYTGMAGQYVIPYSGYYKLSLYGAQGEGYGNYAGGKGGMTEAVIYFRKGQVLQYTIGGQNGYNGGGMGTSFGNGGGYSSVATEEKGVLLIAGGGGGASFLSNGQAGGSRVNNVPECQGQHGMSGGGGGSQGGTAGKAVVHTHKSECEHQHIGNPDRYGGCYTAQEVCGNNNFIQSKYKEIFYYGNINDNGKHIYCVRCGSHSCPGHLNEYFKYQCTLCSNIYYDRKPGYCTSSKYALGCDKETGYLCGYEEGEVIEMTSAYGGSNYVNAEECLTYEEKSGVKTGNGALILEMVSVGFFDENHLNGVHAPDQAAPEAVSVEGVKIKAVDENKVNVVFTRPSDHGTIYYHKAESYDRLNNHKISTSNQTMNLLTSGVCGYYYKLDRKQDLVVTTKDTYLADDGEEPYIAVNITDKRQYLHIAAVDKAGNLSDTVHIPLSAEDVIFWPVITEQIKIASGEQVFQEGEVYYVRADGNTPFSVSFKGKLCGTAQENYQINMLWFEGQNITSGQGAGTFKVQLPVENVIKVNTNTYRGAVVQKQYADTFCLEDASFTEARRSNYCKDLEMTQQFIAYADLDGCKIRLTPGAGVCIENVNVTSNEQADLENSIYLIADGQGPVIEGLNIPDELLDQKGKAWKHKLKITAEDTGCGVKEFHLEIRNTDNGGYELIEDADGDKSIVLELDSENPMFAGNFNLIATARDHVGNETVETYGMDGIGLYAYIKKISDTREEIYKKGEAAKLYIQSIGYIERVEVIFPKEWVSLAADMNRKYTYQIPEFMKAEELEFIVPLQIPDGEYTIVVKAFKGNKMLEADPELLTITVSGSILDEIRTRLR